MGDYNYYYPQFHRWVCTRTYALSAPSCMLSVFAKNGPLEHQITHPFTPQNPTWALSHTSGGPCAHMRVRDLFHSLWELPESGGGLTEAKASRRPVWFESCIYSNLPQSYSLWTAVPYPSLYLSEDRKEASEKELWPVIECGVMREPILACEVDTREGVEVSQQTLLVHIPTLSLQLPASAFFHQTAFSSDKAPLSPLQDRPEVSGY